MSAWQSTNMTSWYGPLSRGRFQPLSLPRVPLLPFGCAIGLLLSSGILHGLWTQRWYPSHELEAAVDRLDHIPLAVRDWEGVAVEPDPQALAQSGLAACKVSTYVQQGAGSPVTMFLMCGRAGPASVHTPEWCYGAAGYEMSAPPVRYTVALEDGHPPAEFWTAQFVKTGPVPSVPLRIFWSWNATGTWMAPTHPRLSFGRYPALYKLYFVHDVQTLEDSLEQDPAVLFMRSFLPELRRVLFPASNM